MHAIEKIRSSIKSAKGRQKSYADRKRMGLKFSVSDKVFLKAALMIGVLRFGKKGKLRPRFCSILGTSHISYRYLPNFQLCMTSSMCQ